ncbi:DUF6152 family protein [Pseudoxanthomonas winnipegensis]|uniref:NirD/YgiW/YdeI family stress tolerance protein n=1 Tax=Pseudoxanthomonas winnipegensis TaxID=2480810 RepID=A0A4Q8LZT5_9GAMM|nr:DUF6152 family protein [Pseudoxanthomonas winnipegensis]RZZ86766.1 hypothetical protein EA663_07700 [Pseudoxanthomonas winnipegensis]TAA38062.1 hypothetical protein EA656_05335 [Pseudoxanthomonas winnipegensis]
MKKAPLSAALAVLSLLSGPAFAHHSFAALYDANKPVRLKGKLTKIDWTNPHTYFHIDVVSRDGSVHNWSVEGAGPGALSRRGFKDGDIKIGDTLIVDGYLTKKPGTYLVDGRLVTLPDGRIINGGTPGDGGPGDKGKGAEADAKQANKAS